VNRISFSCMILLTTPGEANTNHDMALVDGDVHVKTNLLGYDRVITGPDVTKHAVKHLGRGYQSTPL